MALSASERQVAYWRRVVARAAAGDARASEMVARARELARRCRKPLTAEQRARAQAGARERRAARAAARPVGATAIEARLRSEARETRRAQALERGGVAVRAERPARRCGGCGCDVPRRAGRGRPRERCDACRSEKKPARRVALVVVGAAGSGE